MSTYATNIPGAVGANGYANASLAANTAYQNALTRINQNRQSTLRSAGYTGTVDPTNGTITGMQVDPNNPFGGLQSMLRSQAGDFRQAQWSAEDRGLMGGLAHKADSDLKYQHGAQSAQFGTDLANNIGGLQDQQNQAAYTRDSALAQSEQAAAEAAIQAQQFNPGDYSDLTYPTYGDEPAPAANTAPARAVALAKKVTTQKAAAAKVTAKKVTANATGATVQGKRGVISIH